MSRQAIRTLLKDLFVKPKGKTWVQWQIERGMAMAWSALLSITAWLTNNGVYLLALVLVGLMTLTIVYILSKGR